jgi:hypothetical protein
MLILIGVIGGTISLAYASWSETSLPAWLSAYITSLPVSVLICCVLAIVIFAYINRNNSDTDSNVWVVMLTCIPMAILYFWQSHVFPDYIYKDGALFSHALFILVSVSAACAFWILLSLIVEFATDSDHAKSYGTMAPISALLPFLLPLVRLTQTMDQALGLSILIGFSVFSTIVVCVVIWYLAHIISMAQSAP